MHSTTIRIGTRGSALALAQSQWVGRQLEARGHLVEWVIIKTDGDVQSGSLAQIGGQGLFTRRIQRALLDADVDLAVHSLKDLPTEDQPDLVIAAIPERENPADALIARAGLDWKTLPAGARIGTGSVRRAAQLLRLRSDLQIEDIRGNVGTRLEKLETGEFDAIVLACAGLNRLGIGDRVTYEFSQSEMLPAVGQGALGLEIRKRDTETWQAVQGLNHAASQARSIAERAMLQRLFAGCLAPVGASSNVHGDRLELAGVVLDRAGTTRVAASRTATLAEAADLGRWLAEDLLDRGAEPLLKSVR